MNDLKNIQNDFDNFKADALALDSFLTGTRTSYSFFVGKYPELKEEFKRKERSEDEVEGMKIFEELEASVEGHQSEIFKYCFINLIARTDAFLNDAAISIYKWRKPEISDEKRSSIVLKYSHSSFKRKLAHLKKEFGLTFPYIEKNQKIISELFSTRNLILHNNSKVNETYLKLNPSSQLEVGSERVVEEEYFKLTVVMAVLIGKSVFELVCSELDNQSES